MKKWFWGLGIGFGVVVGLLILSVAILLFQLPSPSDLRRRMGDPAPVAARQPASTESNAGSAVNTNSASTTTPNSTGAIAQNSKPASDEVMENYLFDQTRPVSNVCDNIDLAARSLVRNSDMQSNFFKHLDAVVRDDPRDPFAGAVFAPVRYVMRMEGVSKLIGQVKEAEATNDKSFRTKASFYTQLATAYQEIQDRENEINDVGFQAYHLFVLSRLVARRPELSRDDRLQGYCRLLEADIDQERPFDRESANLEMLGLLDSVGVHPADVGFDPNMNSRLQFEVTTNKIQIGFGWLNQLMSEP